MTTSTEIKLTNAELKAKYAALRDEAKAQHDINSGVFKFETFAEFKKQYNVEWDFAHPHEADALVAPNVPSIDTVLDVVATASKVPVAAHNNPDAPQVSKMSMAKAIFQDELDKVGIAGLVRKTILARFVVEAGCTQNGANTYYNTIRGMHGLVTPK